MSRDVEKMSRDVEKDEERWLTQGFDGMVVAFLLLPLLLSLSLSLTPPPAALLCFDVHAGIVFI